MQQADQTVAFRHFFHHFHRQLVLIRRDVAGGVDRRQLMLPGCDFFMLGLGSNTQFPQLIVQIFHKRFDASLDRSKIVII